MRNFDLLNHAQSVKQNIQQKQRNFSITFVSKLTKKGKDSSSKVENELTSIGISSIMRPVLSSRLFKFTTSPPTTMLRTIPSALIAY